MKKDVSLRTAIAVSILLFVLVTDQVIKYFVKTGFCLYEKVQVTDWFQLFFTENKGMAFGLDFFGTMFLAVFRLVAVVLFSVLLVKIVRRSFPIGYIVCVAMIIAGAAGNIIDNCFYGLIFTESLPDYLPFATPATLVPFGEGYGTFLSGKVVDMFYFPLFTWPDWVPLLGGEVFFNAVFNFADASISCGAIALFLFYHKYLTGEAFRSASKEEQA